MNQSLQNYTQIQIDIAGSTQNRSPQIKTHPSVWTQPHMAQEQLEPYYKNNLIVPINVY